MNIKFYYLSFLLCFTIFIFSSMLYKDLPKPPIKLKTSPVNVYENINLGSCAKLKKWKPNSCREITEQDRENIISNSNPLNFPFARFVSPPNRLKPIEEEVDCSRFTHDIYQRVGIEFPLVTTSMQLCLRNFKKISKTKAKPGDLVLFKSHIGILDRMGNIISSGKGGKKKFSMRLPNDKYFLSSIQSVNIKKFGEPIFLQWKCR